MRLIKVIRQSCKESVVSSFFNRPYSITTSKNGLTKENTRSKWVSKENVYQGSIFSKTLKRIIKNHSLSLSKQQTQATDIHEEEVRMSINLLHVKGTSEKLQPILRSHKIRSTFSNETTLIEITLRHGCSPIKLLHFFRTPFLMNSSERLLL